MHAGGRGFESAHLHQADRVGGKHGIAGWEQGCYKNTGMLDCSGAREQGVSEDQNSGERYAARTEEVSVATSGVSGTYRV